MSQTIAPKLASYHLLKEIKESATGTLYQAFDENLEQPVALFVFSSFVVQRENFVVRFELLKTLLKDISHQHLVRVLDMDSSNGLFYLVKEWPWKILQDKDNKEVKNSKDLIDGQNVFGDYQDLHSFDVSLFSSQEHAYSTLFLGIAQGLNALENHKDVYHKEGVFHPYLTFEDIWVVLEKPLVGHALQPVAKVTGFCEQFLCFGDEKSAFLEERFFSLIPTQNQSEDTLYDLKKE